MRSTILATTFLIGVCGVAIAETDWGHDFDDLIAQPGTRVTLGKDGLGEETRDILLPSGVGFLQTRRKNGQIDVMDRDISGHGAVGCMFSILFEIRQMSTFCPAVRDSGWTSELDVALKRIADFMVANGRGKYQPNDLQSMLAKSEAGIKTMSPEAREKACGSISGFVTNYKTALARDKLQKQIDDLLSVPRPPVMNPCL